MVQECCSTAAASRICSLLHVSRSGYYAWRERAPSPRQERRQRLLEAIRQAHQASGGRYGAPRIHCELVAAGMPCALNTVARIMQEEGIYSRISKRFVPRTTDSAHAYAVAENLLAGNFIAAQLNRVWTADITYIATDEGWLYLAVLMDLYSRRIVGWSMADHLRAELAMDALGMAIGRRRPAPGLIHHSDRGVQYACDDYQNLLEAHAIKCSMSGKGNCYDNAPTESFFGKYKSEEVYMQPRYATRDVARHGAFEYIEVFYNRQRKHSSLGYRSPVAFEQSLR
jgi:putative transposase